MWKKDLPILYDWPAREDPITKIAVSVEAKDRRIVDIPHAQGVGNAPAGRFVHLLKEKEVGATQGRLGGQHRDGAVHPNSILDIEGSDPQRGRSRGWVPGTLAWWLARVARPFEAGIVAPGVAGPDDEE